MHLLKNRQLLINILLGLGLISIPFLTSPDLAIGTAMFKITGFQRSFLSYLLLLIFFYVNYYIFIPKFYVQKKWLVLVVVLIACFAIVHIIPDLIIDDQKLPKPEDVGINPSEFSNSIGSPQNSPGGFPDKMPPKGPDNEFMGGLFSRGSYLFQFIMVFVLSLHLRINNYLKEVRNEQLQTEISYLKAQINPHFLFNTLNSIYALALKKEDKTPMAVLKLSNIMRYVVTESDQKSVPLRDEIEYIIDYIDLQKLRLTKDVDVSFNVKGSPANHRIAPMLLIIFVENAFKYGVSPENPSKIAIFMSFENEDEVVLVVENTNFNNQIFDTETTKEGLRNTKKRLEYAYPNKHHLEITETSETYKVRLKIALG
ncbi:MAG: hypothetical protein CL868_02080 [Cytophagaceae bacterium]|nr:hypothetical protein [Cytophagaceae bacterium]|tara:strand:- start:401 stop:1510 length:1110 start_codon:yes stop_codon:yes gene_type:complete